MVLVAIGVAITGVIAFYGYNNSLTSQAFINAPVVSIRAPIPGRTSLGNEISVGQSIQKGQQLAVIDADTENPRVSVLRGQISSLETSRDTLISESAQLKQEVEHRKSEYDGLKSQVKTQKVVDVEGGQASVTMAESELKSALLYEQEAKRNLDQAGELREDKYISHIAYQKLVDEHGRAHARSVSAKERLKRAKVALDAIGNGLQIDGARSLPYVVTRSSMLEEAIADLVARLDHVTQQIGIQGAELEDLKKDLAQQMQARLESPVNGAVWDIISNNGDSVSQQSPVLKVVNCEASWVEAFLDESVAASLQVGDEVKVQEYCGDRAWRGNVISIRYGTGRVTVGQYMVEPPPEVMRRQLPVRVATVKINVDWGTNNIGRSTCNVGSSVKVFST